MTDSAARRRLTLRKSIVVTASVSAALLVVTAVREHSQVRTARDSSFGFNFDSPFIASLAVILMLVVALAVALVDRKRFYGLAAFAGLMLVAFDIGVLFHQADRRDNPMVVVALITMIVHGVMGGLAAVAITRWTDPGGE